MDAFSQPRCEHSFYVVETSIRVFIFCASTINGCSKSSRAGWLDAQEGILRVFPL